MKLWRSSRNEVWNQATVQALIAWRTDCRRVKEYSSFSATSLSHIAVTAYAGIAEVSLLQACEPVFQSLEKLEKSLEILKISGTNRHPHYPYNTFRGEETPQSGEVL